MAEVREISNSMVLICLEEGESLERLVAVVKEYPNRQILVSLDSRPIDAVIAEANRLAENPGSEPDPSLLENLFTFEPKDVDFLRQTMGGKLPPSVPRDPTLGHNGLPKRRGKGRQR